jgi:predicted Zn-dependent protease
MWNRREVLGTLGVASAHTLLWAFGCTPPPRPMRAADEATGGEVRGWLRDAVARLAGAGLAEPHALAVARRRTTAAVDVLGASVQRARCDGVVLAVRDASGVRREQVTCDLSADGVAAAVRALAAAARPARGTSTRPEVWAMEGAEPGDLELLTGLEKLAALDGAVSSRIVYRAEVIDVDDATVWSVSPVHDREQRLVRVRQVATRVAWNGTQPVVSEAVRGWLGAPSVQGLGQAELEAATRGALALMTPTAFDDGDHPIVIEPSISAKLIEAAAQTLWTASAVRRPEVARRLAAGASVAASAITLVDDPTVVDAYGAYRFDDRGEPAAAVKLVDGGHIVGRLGEHCRPGHVGRLSAVPSHLRLAAGKVGHEALLAGDGFVLEGGVGATVDPASDRVVVTVARARELRGGKLTGRVFADIELVGELASLLASVDGVSSEVQGFALRDEVDGQPRWRSIEAPWLHAKARLRARRRQA